MSSFFDLRLKDADFAFMRLVEQGRTRWFCMYSGGKDSTTVTVLALEFAAAHPECHLDIHIVHVNTCVENPILLSHAHTFLSYCSSFARDKNISLQIHEITPPPERRFFVRLLRDGMPPPHPSFRWCTRDMKIAPVRDQLRTLLYTDKSVSLVGLRFGESDARDERLNTSCSRGAECGHGSWLDVSEKSRLAVASPIASWRTCDVWDFLDFEAPARGWKTQDLHKLYLHADMSRFGCWTCTLVSRDRSMQNLITKAEYSNLAPLLWFRDRLSTLIKDRDAHVLDDHGRLVRLKPEVCRSLYAEALLLERLTGVEIISKEEKEILQSVSYLNIST